jgi:hypothetical protein
MTPTSNVLLAKVANGGIAVAVAAIVLALIKHFVWTDLPADLEGPLNTIILALILSGASVAAGWLTSIKPGEITVKDAAIIERAAHDAETKPIEAPKL